MIHTTNPNMATVIIILIVLGVLFLELFFLSKFTKRFSKSIPPSAMQQGAKNAFFTALFILAAFGLISLIVIGGLGQPIREGLFTSFSIFWGVVFFYTIYTWLKSKRISGILLLDIIGFPNKKATLLMGIVLPIVFYFQVDDLGWLDSKYLQISGIFIGLSFAVMQFIMGSSRIQARRNGIVAYTGLIEWDKIDSYTWIYDGKSVYTLKLHFKGRLPSMMRNGAIPIPIEKKEQAETILNTYLPDKAKP